MKPEYILINNTEVSTGKAFIDVFCGRCEHEQRMIIPKQQSSVFTCLRCGSENKLELRIKETP